MAKLMAPLVMGLSGQMQSDMRDVLRDGRGHDWARAMIMANDALVASDYKISQLEIANRELRLFKSRVEALCADAAP